jgi:uncharacterized damage-inducible protein DinB
MTHPLVDQLRFTRSEWRRALEDLSDEDARRRLPPMNSISWMIGHLAWQENRYWLQLAQGKDVAPQLNALVGYGKPATTPPLEEMWAAWRTVTEAADVYLDTLTAEELGSYYQRRGKDISESIGTLLQRVIYHYWYHTGEAMAIRQMLGHTNLPEFVGTFTEGAHYRPR